MIPSGSFEWATRHGVAAVFRFSPDYYFVAHSNDPEGFLFQEALMNLTYGSYLTGMGMADAGATDAGWRVLFGAEYDPDQLDLSRRIADMCDQNIQGKLLRQDVAQIDPAVLPPVDWFHASPVCKQFSVANQSGQESEADISVAYGVKRYIVYHTPRFVTIENVWGYRKSASWEIVQAGLIQAGYQFTIRRVNMADYGVPQTRVRMIVIACLDRRLAFPSMTHYKLDARKADRGKRSLFMRPWRGWYSAVSDLVHTFPLSPVAHNKPCPHDPTGVPCSESSVCRGHFAPWQESRLPEEFTEHWMCETSNASGGADRYATEPSQAVTAQGGGRTRRAFLMNEGNPNGNEKRKYRWDEPPAKTVSSTNSGSTRAFVFPGGNANSARAYYDHEPAMTVGDTERVGNVPRAYMVNGTANDNGRTVTAVVAAQPSFTVVSSAERKLSRSWVNGRVVTVTPRGLARFQSLPDWYVLSGEKTVDLAGIGNGIPSLFMQQIGEYFKTIR